MGSPTRIDGVSAVVCNYDGEAYLEECLRSVLAQEGVDEVLVVDDASEDRSVALVRERFPQVEVVELSENSGPCVARNAGMRAARFRYVLAVDNDAVLEPGTVARLRAALEAAPEAVAAQPRSVLYDETTRIHYDGGGFHYVGILALRHFYAPLASVPAREPGPGSVVDSDALIAISPLLDRDAVLSAGGYDERLFYLAEDFDLALRLRLAGRRILAVEDAVVRHRGGTAGLSFRGGSYPAARTRLHARNRWRIVLKCYRWRTLLAALPGIGVYELAWLVFAARQGNLRAHLAGKLEALRGLGDTLRARRAVQLQRRVADRTLLVGGPLTLSPSLVEKPLARRLAGALDALLRGWWEIARRASG